MFLKQIKHINVGFDSPTTREFLQICLYTRISSSTREISDNLTKNRKFTTVLKYIDLRILAFYVHN